MKNDKISIKHYIIIIEAINSNVLQKVTVLVYLV